MLDYGTALLLSIIEGLTEFIPVSSTGHMILTSAFLGLADDDESIKTFEIFIQLGAILSVVALYPARFLSLLSFTGVAHESDGLTGRRGIKCFAVACIPVFICGFLFHKFIKEVLFSPITVACALIVGGVAMIVIERKKLAPRVRELDEISIKDSFLIGLAQCFALWPGMSRSGATIIGGMLVGLERRVAAEFSFLIAVPVMCVAVGYDLLKSVKSLDLSLAPIFLFGFVVAFFVSLFAVRYFVALLGRVTLREFGWYRILLGLVVLGFSGKLFH